MTPRGTLEIDVVFRYHDLGPQSLRGRAAAVIDVLRATSTICFALAAGCKRVVPVESIRRARSLAASLPRSEFILAGERKCRRIPGFDMGNSPQRFTPSLCRGRTLILTTTNGTRAIHAAAAAEMTLVACLANARAAARVLAESALPVTLICSGTDRRFTLDDAVCAGAVVKYIERRGKKHYHRTAGAERAVELFERHKGDIAAALLSSVAGRALARAGLKKDVLFCAAARKLRIVPRLDAGRMEILPR